MHTSDSVTTKKQLADALRELVTVHPFASITIGDICCQCGLNRKSFYYHFRDKYDLVCWIFYTDFFDNYLMADGEDDNGDTLRSLCLFMERDKAFYRAILKVEGQNSLQEYMTDILRPIISRRLEKKFGLDPDRAFYLELFVSLWQTTICNWVLDGCRTPAEKLVRLMYNASASLNEAAPE